MRKLRWILAPLAVGLLALIVACGGDKGSQDSNSSSYSSGSGSSVSQELNLADAATQLMELRSFKFNLKFNLDLGDMSGLTGSTDSGDEFGAGLAQAFLALFSDVSVEGAYVAPDSFDVKMSLAGEDVHMIQIGDEAWVDDGSGWVATEPGDTELTPFGNPSDLTTDLIPNEVLQNAEISSEKVNGLDTTHYHFDKDSLQAVAQDLGQETSDFGDVDSMTLDVWLAEGNIPVKLTVDVAGKGTDGGDMALKASFDITDINSDIKIDRPIP
jgi:hypothetical protein